MLTTHQRWQRLIILGITGLGGLVMAVNLPVAAQKTFTPQQFTQSQWPLIASSTGRFAVTFPTQPNVTHEIDGIEGAPIEIHEFSRQYLHGCLYRFTRSVSRAGA